MKDASIIELFWNRDENAIKETKQKYGRLCASVAENMLDSEQDCEECVSDTYLTAWNCIPPAKPDRFPAFLCKITRNLALKKIEYNTAIKRNKNMVSSLDELGDCVSGSGSAEEHVDMHELTSAINSFLSAQKKREQMIFVKRYWLYEPLADIAKEVGTSEKNVTLILFRLRERLKDYLIKEGFNV